MGLDTTHDCWHGAYSAFSRWRDKLAEVAGYEIAKAETDMGLRETVLIDWGHVTQANLDGDWDSTPADPLLILIAHSDCECGYRLGKIRLQLRALADAGWLDPTAVQALRTERDEARAIGKDAVAEAAKAWRAAQAQMFTDLDDAGAAHNVLIAAVDEWQKAVTDG